MADASVIINIVASGFYRELLQLIARPFYVADVIISELERGASNGCIDGDVLKSLIEQKVIKCVTLNPDGWKEFEGMVSGASLSTLDDGEAATLAYCATENAIPIIDERKANRICRERYLDISPINSVTLFMMASSLGRVAHENLSEAIFKALFYGRMRVMQEDLEWVIGMIGIENAARCNSLPLSVRRQSLLVEELKTGTFEISSTDPIFGRS
ncbi:MAG: hypothetical protein ABW148_00820 [Sedimenticola sp.]